MNTAIINLRNKKYNFNPNVCPDEISLEMLIETMKSPDTNFEAYGKDQLWAFYYSVMFPPNKFGLTADLTKKNAPLFYFEEVGKFPNE
jgi:hypothetical protein